PTTWSTLATVSTDERGVPDTIEDPRFADNPDVARRNRVRFYTECPLFVGQSRVGSLCVLDVRPRHISAEQLVLRNDVAAWVERELQQLHLRCESDACYQALLNSPGTHASICTSPQPTLPGSNWSSTSLARARARIRNP